jgi:hypothetical protein
MDPSVTFACWPTIATISWPAAPRIAGPIEGAGGRLLTLHEFVEMPAQAGSYWAELHHLHRSRETPPAQ